MFSGKGIGNRSPQLKPVDSWHEGCFMTIGVNTVNRYQYSSVVLLVY